MQILKKEKGLKLWVLLIGLFSITNLCFGAEPVWGPDVRLTNNLAYSEFPAITSDANGIHIVWRDTRDGNHEIYYKRSQDGGNTWGPDVRLTNNSAVSGEPTITSDANGIHIVWYDYRDGNWEIYYKRSQDGGNTWESDVRLTDNLAYSFYPAITSNANGIHIVWVDYRDGNYEIYYKRSQDGGNTWGPDVRLTNALAVSGVPAITSDANGIHIVWVDERDGNYEIYYKRSQDGGNTWGPDVRLTNALNTSRAPAITSDANGIHIVWYDDRDGNWEIYYKRSQDGGNTWGLDVRLTNNSAVSGEPAITSDANGIHIVWDDNRDGNMEIYYKRGTFSPPPPSFTINIILNQGTFTTGETVKIDVRVDNPGSDTTVDVRICIKLPTNNYLQLIKMDDLTIPAGGIGPLNLITYTFTGNEPVGKYEVPGRLLHPNTGASLTTDIESFKFTP
ncbi:MAG: sialidase family protein [bacterium]